MFISINKLFRKYMKTKLATMYGAAAGFFLPIAAFAQGPTIQGGTGLNDIIDWFVGLLRIAVPILVSIAVIYFIINVIKFVVAKGGEDKTAARDHMVWGLIGLFVILAFWGIIALISNTLEIGLGGQPTGVIPGVGL
jgi:hypothetical protein